MGIVTHAYHPSIWEEEAGGTDVQGHSQVHSELTMSLSLMNIRKIINLENQSFLKEGTLWVEVMAESTKYLRIWVQVPSTYIRAR